MKDIQTDDTPVWVQKIVDLLLESDRKRDTYYQETVYELKRVSSALEGHLSSLSLTVVGNFGSIVERLSRIEQQNIATERKLESRLDTIIEDLSRTGETEISVLKNTTKIETTIGKLEVRLSTVEEQLSTIIALIEAIPKSIDS